MMKGFNRSLYVIEGQNAKIQPVWVNDVMQAMGNALKQDETIGQTYDLGGPHEYTVHEYYEMLFNICQIKPYVVPVKMERALELMRSPSHSSWDRFMGQYYFYPHFMTLEACDVLCRPGSQGFKELNILPVSLG